MKREASVTPLVEKYVKLKKIYGHIEVKQTTTNRFNLNNFESQQLSSLEAAEQTGMVMKWSDADPRLKPCDIISTPPGMPSLIAISYPKTVFFIYATKIIECKETLKLKSLTEEMARKLCIHELRK